MSRQKQLISKRVIINLGILFIAVGSMIYAAPSHRAYAVSDCSDVYTPLSTFVVNGVNANKTFYVNAMNETGVPWEMLAAIHYRETGFSHSNPSNGNGIFQFSGAQGGPYPPGPVSDEEFYRQLKFMASKLQSDYVWRGSVPRERRQLQPGETNIVLSRTHYTAITAARGYTPTRRLPMATIPLRSRTRARRTLWTGLTVVAPEWVS